MLTQTQRTMLSYIWGLPYFKMKKVKNVIEVSSFSGFKAPFVLEMHKEDFKVKLVTTDKKLDITKDNILFMLGEISNKNITNHNFYIGYTLSKLLYLDARYEIVSYLKDNYKGIYLVEKSRIDKVDETVIESYATVSTLFYNSELVLVYKSRKGKELVDDYISYHDVEKFKHAIDKALEDALMT